MSKILITGGNPSIMRAMIEKIAKERDLDLTGVKIEERIIHMPHIHHLTPFAKSDFFAQSYPERKTYHHKKRGF